MYPIRSESKEGNKWLYIHTWRAFTYTSKERPIYPNQFRSILFYTRHRQRYLIYQLYIYIFDILDHDDDEKHQSTHDRRFSRFFLDRVSPLIVVLHVDGEQQLVTPLWKWNECKVIVFRMIYDPPIFAPMMWNCPILPRIWQQILLVSPSSSGCWS